MWLIKFFSFCIFRWTDAGESGACSVPVRAHVEAESSFLEGSVTTQFHQTEVNTAKGFGSNTAPATWTAALTQVWIAQNTTMSKDIFSPEHFHLSPPVPSYLSVQVRPFVKSSAKAAVTVSTPIVSHTLWCGYPSTLEYPLRTGVNSSAGLTALATSTCWHLG